MKHDQSDLPELAPDTPQDAAADTPLNAQGRRRFLRASAVSGAVLLTLHNRAAWGGGNGQKQKQVCVSENAWLSYNAAAPSAIDRYENDKEQFNAFQKYQKTLGKSRWEQQTENLPEGKVCRVRK